VPIHLAQINVGTLRRPLDDPMTAPFVDALAEVNALGEAAAGFVWRLQTPAGDATAIGAFENPLTIINLTVWESIDALRGFAYRGLHRDFFRRRAEWFEPDAKRVALWWIPAGTVPTVDEAICRLEFLERRGPTPFAFPIGPVGPAPFVIHRVGLDDPRAQALIGELDHELTGLYPEPGSTHFRLDDHEVAPGAGAFFVGELDGRPVACGAYRRIEEATAEVKRMYVHPAVRGQQLGAAILASIEQAAAADGNERLVLETGPRQHAAIHLYETFGFTPKRCWGEYEGSPVSTCLGKDLPSTPHN